MASNSQVIAAQMQRVRPKLQEWIETTTNISGLIKRAAETHKISTYSKALNDGSTLNAFRVPLALWIGGDYRTYSPDEGDMGSGSMANLTDMSFGYFPDLYAVKIPDLSAESTASSEQSVVNIFKYQMKQTIKQYQGYYDTGFFQDGTGVLATGGGTGTPSSPNPTYNLEANFGPQRLRLGQKVDVFRAALDVKMNSGGEVQVTAIDFTNKTVTLTGAVAGGCANTDRITFAGMSATLAVGSWRNGLYTFNSSAASGTTGGLNRATATEIVTPTVNAQGNALVPAHGLLLNDIIIQRRDEDALAGMVGVSHMAQRHAVYMAGIAISEWQRGKSDSMIDMVPKDISHSTTFPFCGQTYRVSKKADRSRMDLFIPKNWCRALLHEAKFHETPDGRRFFELRSQSTGNVAAGFQFFMKGSEQLVCVDPGAAGTISNLALPAGY